MLGANSAVGVEFTVDRDPCIELQIAAVAVDEGRRGVRRSGGVVHLEIRQRCEPRDDATQLHALARVAGQRGSGNKLFGHEQAVRQGADHPDRHPVGRGAVRQVDDHRITVVDRQLVDVEYQVGDIESAHFTDELQR